MPAAAPGPLFCTDTLSTDHPTPAARAAGRLARALGDAASAPGAGLALMLALFVYLALASIWPPPPGAPAGTPGSLYALWPLKVLLVGLVVNLLLATVRRVRPGWAGLGTWLAHAGVVVLAGGAAWYAARHVSGVAVAARGDPAGAFSRVDRFFVNGTAAIYATPSGEPSAATQTPLGPLPPARRPIRLDAPVESPFDDVVITASRYLPAAAVAMEWRDDGPAEVPAVEVVIDDGPRRLRRTICPAYPFAGAVETDAYAVSYVRSLADVDTDVRKGPADASEVKDWVVIAPAGGGGVEVGVFDYWGKRRGVERVATGKRIELALRGREVGLTVVRCLTRAWLAGEASGVSPGKGGAAVRLDVAAGDWRGSQWIGFDPYVGRLDPADRVLQRLPLPGRRMLYLHFAPQSRPLPRPFRVADLEYRTYPGSAEAMDYACTLEVSPAGVARPQRLGCRLNQPADVAGFRVYQNTWGPRPDAPDEIVFTVSSRPGIEAVWLGCVLICLGLPYAFYVKPLLTRRRPRAGP